MRPLYDYGDEVRVLRNLRNDGTFPGQPTGALLVRRGSTGYVRDVGTFLQDQIIYSVHFLDSDQIVGCRQEELQPAGDPWTPSRFESREKVAAHIALGRGGRVLVEQGRVGEVIKVLRGPTTARADRRGRLSRAVPGLQPAAGARVGLGACASVNASVRIIPRPIARCGRSNRWSKKQQSASHRGAEPMSASQAIDSPAHPDQKAAEHEGYRYHLLRAATARFQRNIPALSREELAQAERQAERSFALEEQVLSSAEARDVLIPDTQLQRSFQEIKQRYKSQSEMEADLKRNGLDSRHLRQALRRELIFDAVMQRVGARHAPITNADEQLFYELHQERFNTPETRSARHILITINDDYPENSRGAARARIETIAERLRAQTKPEQAQPGLDQRLYRRSSKRLRVPDCDGGWPARQDQRWPALPCP